MSPSNDPVCALRFTGELTIAEVAAMRAQLSDALRDHISVAVDCSAVDGADVSVLQLLLAARRTAADASKALAFEIPTDGAVARALAQAGIPPAALNDHGASL